MMYRECPNCGAHLDPGEKCDCKAAGGCAEDLNEGEAPAGRGPTAEAANRAAIAEALEADVTIELRKEKGSSVFGRRIEASSASAALNGIAVLIAEYSRLTDVPVLRVLALLAATMSASALREKNEPGDRQTGAAK